MEKTIKEITEIFDGLDILAESAGRVYKDKKVDMTDLPVLIDMAVRINTLMEAFKGLDEAVEEAKDLDAGEQLAIVNRVFQVAKKYEAARTA